MSVIFYEDSISITDEAGEEVVMWVQDEWEEDPSIVFSIANAVKLYYEKGVEHLKKVLGR